MNTDTSGEWSQWLQQQGATAVGKTRHWPDDMTHLAALDAGTHSADSQAQQGVLVDNTSLSVVDVTGDDAATFLQSQFCNDVQALPDGRAQLNGYCSPKGRLLALFTLFATDEGYRLVMPASVSEAFVKRLSMFVMRATVTVTLRHDQHVIGLAAADARLGELLGGVAPDNVWAWTSTTATTEAAQCVCWPGLLNGYRRVAIIGSITAVQAIWSSAQHHAMTGGERLWRRADIDAGIPRLESAIAEAFVPQMVNLQQLDGLSFRKGCYPGQEIVARMQYLGKLKRHMLRFRSSVPTGDIAVPGDVLVADGDNNAGQVVDAVPAGDHMVLLAVVKTSVKTDAFRLGETALMPLDLPYPLVDADSSDAASTVAN